jgi:hypothetical protein
MNGRYRDQQCQCRCGLQLNVLYELVDGCFQVVAIVHVKPYCSEFLYIDHPGHFMAWVETGQMVS